MCAQAQQQTKDKTASAAERQDLKRGSSIAAYKQTMQATPKRMREYASA
jgi:hypothetical protein